MSEIITHCPHCGSILKAETDWIGAEVTCPTCAKQFTVVAEKITPTVGFLKKDTFPTDAILNKIIGLLGEIKWELLDFNYRRFFISLGSTMILLIGALSCIGILNIHGFVKSIGGFGSYFLMVLAVLLTCVFSAYINGQIFRMGNSFISKNPDRMSSSGLLNCIAIFSFIIALAALAFSIKIFIDEQIIAFLLGGIGVFILLSSISIVAARPQLIHLEIDEQASGSEDFISINMFFIKGLMVVLPYCWCTLLVAIAGNLLIRLGADDSTLYGHLAITAMIAGILILIPLVVYFSSLAIYFTFGICKSILIIPSKITSLTNKEPNK